MDNIVTYAETMLDGFERTPFNAVDSLALSWACGLRYPQELKRLRSWRGVRFAELFRAEYFGEYFSHIWDGESTRRLFTAMAASPRFRDIRVLGRTEQKDAALEKQFTAQCYQLSPAESYVAFRGTDATLVGWKEDFNMAYQYPVPSQQEALSYLAEAAGQLKGQIRVGGHSKGGNLAVYAAANSAPDVKGRIAAVYSHDGPGFLDSALRSEAFRSIADRLDKTVPQSSLIGLLMEQQEQYRIVKSSGFSVWQHNPFSWEVDLEKNDFRPSDTLTPDARYLDKTLNEWALSMTREERETLIDTLYEVISVDNAETFAELRADWKKTFPAIARAAAELDPDTRAQLLRAVRGLAELARKNFPELWRQDAGDNID